MYGKCVILSFLFLFLFLTFSSDYEITERQAKTKNKNKCLYIIDVIYVRMMRKMEQRELFDQRKQSWEGWWKAGLQDEEIAKRQCGSCRIAMHSNLRLAAFFNVSVQFNEHVTSTCHIKS